MSEPFIPEEFRRFPQRWEVVPFIKAFSDETGGNPKIKKGDYLDAGCLPVIDQGQEDIAGYIDDPDLHCRASLPCLLFGDHTKVFKYVDQPFALGADGVKVLRPSTNLDTRFAYHYLRQLRLPEKAGYSRHFKFLKRAYVPLPPRSEQRRIAAILDKTNAIRRKRQEALRYLANLKTSIFCKMFGNVVRNSKGWPTSRIGDVCDSRLGKMLDAKQQTGNHQRPYLRNANVQWNRLDLFEVLEMDFREKDRKIFRLRYGDVLICEGGEVGRAALWHDQLPECYFQKALHRVRPDPAIVTPEYIVNLMWFYAHNGGFKNHVTSATIAHLTGVKLKEIVIPIPLLSLQKEFIARVREIMKLEAEQVESSHRLDDLFNSLVKRSFHGEFVPTEAELAQQEGRSYKPASPLLAKIREQKKDVKPQ